MRYVWLSFPLGLSDPRPPAIPAPELTPLYTIADDAANVQILKVASHTGTHVDSPLHVIENGLSLADYDVTEFIYTRPVVIDLRLADGAVVTPAQITPFAADLADADIALFRFGAGSIRQKDPLRFSLRSPGFGIDAARWLRSEFRDLRAVGMDVPSLACIDCLDETMAAHNELLGGDGSRMLVIEDMDLDRDLTNLREVRLSPWLVTGMDSGPCSAVGVLEETDA